VNLTRSLNNDDPIKGTRRRVRRGYSVRNRVAGRHQTFRNLSKIKASPNMQKMRTTLKEMLGLPETRGDWKLLAGLVAFGVVVLSSTARSWSNAIVGLVAWVAILFVCFSPANRVFRAVFALIAIAAIWFNHSYLSH
jgi:hypothetical protein